MRFHLFLLIVLFCTACARPGAPTGGPQDTEPPKVVTAFPADKSLFFTGREIQITFDEYIQLKDLNNQLLVSPPLAGKVKHTLKKKTLVLTFDEDLKDSTTYTFSFGKGVTDLNEGNIAEGLRYVVSTGAYIDSLGFSGRVLDAFTNEPEKGLMALLYAPNDTIPTDSLLYKAFPSYYAIANEQGQFVFENLKKGTFHLFGLLDKNANFLYNGPPEKVAFSTELVVTDTLMQPINLQSFKEKVKPKLLNAQYKAYGQVDFNFNGQPDSLVVMAFYPDADSLFEITDQLVGNAKNDTLSFFFAPRDETNRHFLVFVDTATIPDTAQVFLRAGKQPKLSVKSTIGAELHPPDTFKLQLSLPLKGWDTEKFRLILNDTVFHPFEVTQNPRDPLHLVVLFDRGWEQNFKLELAPAALQDLFGMYTDSLAFSCKTNTETDYGNWTIDLQTDTVPVILAILSEKDEVLKSFYSIGNQTIKLPLTTPGKYKLRLVFDANNNRVWDTGNLVEKRNPELVFYNSTLVEIRANWDVDTSWDARLETLLPKPVEAAASTEPPTELEE